MLDLVEKIGCFLTAQCTCAVSGMKLCIGRYMIGVCKIRHVISGCDIGKTALRV